MNLADALGLIETLASSRWAEKWDRVGLQIGNPANEVRGIFLALDPSASALEEASKRGCNLVITHHPLFFRPLERIEFGSESAALIERALRERIAVVSIHTNLDSAQGGLNDWNAEVLGLREVETLQTASGHAGGLGRVGALAHELTLSAFVEQVKRAYGVPTLRFAGNPELRIRRIAVCSGSGRDLIPEARRAGVQCFVTADLHYHDALTATQELPALIGPGHFAMEILALAPLSQRLSELAQKKGFDVRTEIYRGEKDPFIFH